MEIIEKKYMTSERVQDLLANKKPEWCKPYKREDGLYECPACGGAHGSAQGLAVHLKTHLPGHVPSNYAKRGRKKARGKRGPYRKTVMVTENGPPQEKEVKEKKARVVEGHSHVKFCPNCGYRISILEAMLRAIQEKQNQEG